MMLITSVNSDKLQVISNENNNLTLQLNQNLTIG